MELLHHRDEDCMTRQIELTTRANGLWKPHKEGDYSVSVLLWGSGYSTLHEKKKRGTEQSFSGCVASESLFMRSPRRLVSCPLGNYTNSHFCCYWGIMKWNFPSNQFKLYSSCISLTTTPASMVCIFGECFPETAQQWRATPIILFP